MDFTPNNSKLVITSNDVKDIVAASFNGQEEVVTDAEGNKSTKFVNSMSEQIAVVDEGGNTTSIDIAEFLNIEFYSWRNRLVEARDGGYGEQYALYDDWVQSLDFSTDRTFALVETQDGEITTSQDIDNAALRGEITFIIPVHKAYLLDYYVAKLRAAFAGKPQSYTSRQGNLYTVYLFYGIPAYDSEPVMTQFGECLIIKLPFSFAYLNAGQAYSDTLVEISFDGDDEYNESGNPTTNKYNTIPLTRHTWQDIFTANAVPTANRPDLTGNLISAASLATTLTFFDFNEALNERIDGIFWAMSAYRIDGVIMDRKDVNIPVYVRVTARGHKYVYKLVIDSIEKTFVNNDFTVTSMRLKTWGKIPTAQSMAQFTHLRSIQRGK